MRQEKKGVLHVSNWYPHSGNEKKALWVRRMIHSLDEYETNKLYHIEVEPGTGFSFSKESTDRGGRSYYMRVPFRSWRLIEFLTSLLLLYVLLFKERQREFKALNFHIAYPLLTYYPVIARFIRVPVLITEHWSAYHFHFNVPERKKLKRIKRIFKQEIPLGTVSKALMRDIESFSGTRQEKGVLIPNVVDTRTFRFEESFQAEHGRFFMLSNWKWPKDPFTVLRAFERLLAQHSDPQLRIAGYGPLFDELERKLEEKELSSKVRLLGSLEPEKVAEEMNRAHRFLHCSEYESFSVVCAEALCCGTPVIASKVGGIEEVLDQKGGTLVEGISVERWAEALEASMSKRADPEERKEVSRVAMERFSPSNVGALYSQWINEVAG